MRYLPIVRRQRRRRRPRLRRGRGRTAATVMTSRAARGRAFLHRRRAARPRAVAGRLRPYSRLRVTSRYRAARREDAPRRIRSMIQASDELLEALRAAVAEVAPATRSPPPSRRRKQAAHGDLAITAAMPLAKPLKRNPREVAAASWSPRCSARPAVAALGRGDRDRRPRLHQPAPARGGAPSRRRRRGARRRRRASAASRPTASAVIVEFVSANPTGPLHVGHARQAALGDAICNLLATPGLRGQREFYYNDAGVQIATLAALGARRASTASSRATPAGPSTAYNGDYIADIAADFLARQDGARPTTASSPPRATRTTSTRSASSPSPTCATSRISTCRPSACASTTTSSSRACTRAAAVETTVRAPGRLRQDLRGGRRAVAAHHRLRRRQGPRDAQVRRHATPTSCPTSPTTSTKFERGFAKAINVQGTDHHGTDRARARRPAGGRRGRAAGLPRLRAAQDGHGDARRRRRSRSPSAPAAT